MGMCMNVAVHNKNNNTELHTNNNTDNNNDNNDTGVCEFNEYKFINYSFNNLKIIIMIILMNMIL